MKTKIYAIAFCLLVSGMVSCDKSGTTTSQQNNLDGKQNTANFIPSDKKKYHYEIRDQEGIVGQAIKEVAGTEDSSGLTLYTIRTLITTDNGETTLNNKMFAASGKTVTELVMPDMWNDIIDMLKSLPDMTVVEATPVGFPAYEIMDNPLSTSSKLTYSGPAKQGQYIKMVQHNDDGDDTYEVIQEIKYNPGEVVAVENLEVVAGTFACSKWEYSMDNTQIMKLNGVELNRKSFHEKVTLWTAHGIGIVKSLNVTESGTSSTVLTNIE